VRNVGKDEGSRDRRDRFRPRRPPVDENTRKIISDAETLLSGSMEPHTLKNLNPEQRKIVQHYFMRTQEYLVKTYREEDSVFLKIYPAGQLRRFAEQKAQEVLLKGDNEALPHMGSFERFIVHDYLKDRNGIHTESQGEGDGRHILISPIFGRTLKKARRKFSR